LLSGAPFRLQKINGIPLSRAHGTRPLQSPEPPTPALVAGIPVGRAGSHPPPSPSPPPLSLTPHPRTAHRVAPGSPEVRVQERRLRHPCGGDDRQPPGRTVAPRGVRSNPRAPRGGCPVRAAGTGGPSRRLRRTGGGEGRVEEVVGGPPAAESRPLRPQEGPHARLPAPGRKGGHWLCVVCVVCSKQWHMVVGCGPLQGAELEGGEGNPTP